MKRLLLLAIGSLLLLPACRKEPERTSPIKSEGQSVAVLPLVPVEEKKSVQGPLVATGKADASQHWVTKDVQVPRLQQRTFDSLAVGAKVSYFIYTPEIYDTEKERRFPVLYWLHGSGGGLPGLSPVSKYFDTAIKAGKIPPMLIVFANGLTGSLWSDSKDGKTPMETVVIKELLPHIDVTYRTRAAREGRIIEGFSMGGYGAMRLGCKYPELFAAISSLAGGPLQEDFTEAPRAGVKGRDQVFEAVCGSDMDYFKAISPWLLAEQNKTKLLSLKMPIRQVIGDQDSTLAINRNFDARLTTLEIPHTFTVVPGVAHDTMKLFEGLGEGQWEFYRVVFGERK